MLQSGFKDKMSPERWEMLKVAGAIESYSEIHGHAPTNWSELQSEFDISQITSNLQAQGVAGPIEKYYTFLPHPVPRPRHPQVTVILIGNQPQRKGNPHGRVYISKHDGLYSAAVMDENEVAMLLTQHSITLPKK